MNQIQQFIQYILDAVRFWVIVQPWQQGIRVRMGKRQKLMVGGIYFKLPYFDTVFIQDTKLRVLDMSIQTVTTKDHKTVTLNSACGYLIADISTLYNTICHPEKTICNIAMSTAAEYFFSTDAEDIQIEKLEEYVLGELQKLEYGIDFTYFKVPNFAITRAYRLISDRSWSYEGLDLTKKV